MICKKTEMLQKILYRCDQVTEVEKNFYILLSASEGDSLPTETFDVLLYKAEKPMRMF